MNEDDAKALDDFRRDVAACQRMAPEARVVVRPSGDGVNHRLELILPAPDIAWATEGHVVVGRRAFPAGGLFAAADELRLLFGIPEAPAS